MKRISRKVLADELSAVGSVGAKALAGFVRETREDGAVPCWGAIVARATEALTGEALETLWLQMVLQGDSRVLLALLHLMRMHPKLVVIAARDASAVPPVVRQGLTALLDPNASEAQRGFETRVRDLLAVQYVMPDSVAPLRESQRRRKTNG